MNKDQVKEPMILAEAWPTLANKLGAGLQGGAEDGRGVPLEHTCTPEHEVAWPHRLHCGPHPSRPAPPRRVRRARHAALSGAAPARRAATPPGRAHPSRRAASERPRRAERCVAGGPLPLPASRKACGWRGCFAGSVAGRHTVARL